ncbi:MAG: SRPBCC family protein [Pseudomonadales bacterium]
MNNSLKSIAAVVVLMMAATFVIDSDWEVRHEVVIAAEPSTVWSLLIDIERYPEWNRYSPKVTGRVEVGEVVWVEAHLNEEVQRVKNIVLSVKSEQELCWQSAGWYGFLARGTRCRLLSRASNGGTLLVHHELMSGPLAWLIEWLYRERIEKGIKLVDESVAERAELLTTGEI